jgi:hypothetical protein
MSISKLKYINLTETKNAIFEGFTAPQKLKDALFTIVCKLQEKNPKLRLKDVSFKTDKTDFFYVCIKYKNQIINKVISKKDIINTEIILLEILKNI